MIKIQEEERRKKQEEFKEKTMVMLKEQQEEMERKRQQLEEKEKERRKVMERQKVEGQACLVAGARKHAVVTRFTEPGQFRIKVVGSIKHSHPLLQTPETLLDYVINNTGVFKPPFPSELNSRALGSSRKFRAAGFSVLEPDIPIVSTDTGRVTVKIRFPTCAILPNLYELVCVGAGSERSRCDSAVVAWRDNDVATYFIQCASAAQYLFTIFTKYNKPEDPKIGLNPGAAFLIESKQAARP